MTFVNDVLFPVSAERSELGHLEIGGCDSVSLAKEFGTPLYVYDEETLRRQCKDFTNEFINRYADTQVVYASKAFTNPKLVKLLNGEGLGLDVVSGGELEVAHAAGAPMDAVYFHGNNKTPEELQLALDYKVGRIVVDGFSELSLLDDLARSAGVVPTIMLRVSPGVDPHTHVYTTTGVLDSKFGFSMETGHAAEAVRQAVKASNLDLVGLHFHLGSPIFELEPYAIAIDTVLTFASELRNEGFELREFSPGGGFAIGYVMSQLPPPVSDYADVICSTVKSRCAALGLDEPKLIIEPGRAIVGRAGVALYTVGAIKEIPGVRKYVSLDGGMGDNIRPALYDAAYEAVVANHMLEEPTELVTLAGKYCESGDVLIRDIMLPVMSQGDLVALPSSGAYAPSMASPYNLNPRPAIVMVCNGMVARMRRRETYQDLMAYDVEDGEYFEPL